MRLPPHVALDDNTGWLEGAGLSAEVIPNFIPDDIVLDEIPPTAPQAPLLFVGDLSLDKGVPTLLEAYRLLEGPPPLVLAGRSSPGASGTSGWCSVARGAAARSRY